VTAQGIATLPVTAWEVAWLRACGRTYSAAGTASLVTRAVGWETLDGITHCERIGPGWHWQHRLMFCGLHDPHVVAEYNVDAPEGADPDKPPPGVCRACWACLCAGTYQDSTWEVETDVPSANVG
jgi:hypothetical protein